MASNGTYFLSRIIKKELLNSDGLLQALKNPSQITIGDNSWTFIDLYDRTEDSNFPFLFGKLAKYKGKGAVPIVDQATNTSQEIYESNLLISLSCFVYLPQFSGIAYLQVWNQINEATFRNRFETLISDHYQHFFHSCEINAITDYRIFSDKIITLDTITSINAKINPPNPLFGRLWGPLKEYVEKRNASEVQIIESSSTVEGINTEINMHVKNILENSNYEPKKELDIADAAILMAADGYGTGKIEGRSGTKKVVVRTSDQHKSFKFTKDPIPEELAEEARIFFEKINKERDMEH